MHRRHYHGPFLTCKYICNVLLSSQRRGHASELDVGVSGHMFMSSVFVHSDESIGMRSVDLKAASGVGGLLVMGGALTIASVVYVGFLWPCIACIGPCDK